MERRRFDAVVFDLFGTLVDLHSDEHYRAQLSQIADALGVPHEAFIRTWRATHADREVGRYGGLEEDMRAVLDLLNASHDAGRIAKAMEMTLRTVADDLVPTFGAVDTLRALRGSGYRMALVSGSSSAVPLLWESTPFPEFIEAPVFSCEERMMKPDARIYLTACRRLGVQPERCLYVGDGASRELTGAKAVGMRPVLIRIERDHQYDAMRADALEWTGSSVRKLPELIDLIAELEAEYRAEDDTDA